MAITVVPPSVRAWSGDAIRTADDVQVRVIRIHASVYDGDVCINAAIVESVDVGSFAERRFDAAERRRDELLRLRRGGVRRDAWIIALARTLGSHRARRVWRREGADNRSNFSLS
jgi:hypothetical protein